MIFDELKLKLKTTIETKWMF